MIPGLLAAASTAPDISYDFLTAPPPPTQWVVTETGYFECAFVDEGTPFEQIFDGKLKKWFLVVDWTFYGL